VNGKEWLGPVHTLVVQDVVLDDEVGDAIDYVLHHPSSCYVPSSSGSGAFDCVDSHCAVDSIINNVGLAESIKYSHQRITETGIYKIRAWQSGHYSNYFGAGTTTMEFL
jgi:hypothetical protein